MKRKITGLPSQVAERIENLSEETAMTESGIIRHIIISGGLDQFEEEVVNA